MKDIGKILRDYRNNAGLSVKAVSDTLIKKGIEHQQKPFTVGKAETAALRQTPY